MQQTFFTNIATLWKISHVRKAPGTAGSFIALLLAPLCFLPFSFPIRIAILIALFLLGIKACDCAEKELQEKDPSSVIIDEVVGQWTTLLPLGTYSYFSGYALLPHEIYILIIGFMFFRVFDITKIGPVGLCERKFNGGLGIMLDDLVAGFLGACFMYPIQYYAIVFF